MMKPILSHDERSTGIQSKNIGKGNMSIDNGKGDESDFKPNIRNDNQSTLTKEQRPKIKLATGWERGADGKWRYEMPDINLFDNLENSYKSGFDNLLDLYFEENNRKSLPTEDVAREDQIFIYNSLVLSNYLFRNNLNNENKKPDFKDFNGDVIAFSKAVSDWNKNNSENNNNFAENKKENGTNKEQIL